MKIALVAHHARPTGGQDRYLLELARRLSARHDVHLVVVKAEGLADARVTVHEVGIADRPMLLLAPRFARRASALVRDGGFDIVHALGGCMPGANVITAPFCQAAWREARRRYRVPDSSLLDGWYHTIVTNQAVRFERRAYRSPALRAVIPVSHGTAAELGRYYGVDEGMLHVVHNGLDPQSFDRARYPNARAALRKSLGISDDAMIALLVGTYVRKGLDTAIQAVSLAGDDLHLVVAGAGNETLARRWSVEAGLGGRLHLLGPRRDVAELYAAADMFILPTRYEPYGMVITEAMASSLPVVVSACAGAAELIVPGKSGFIVDRADDAEGFAEPLRRLSADAALRTSIGAAARVAALADTWDSMTADTERIYAAVVQ